MSDMHSVEREEVMAYLDGELVADRAAKVAAHLERCEECQGFAADLGGVSRRLASWKVDAPSAWMAPRVTRKRSWPFRVRWAMGVAALLVVTLGVEKARRARVPPHPLRDVAEMAAPGPPPVQRMVERRAELVLAATDFDKARTGMEAIVRRHGGYASALTVTASQGAARALDATVRVPADQLDAVLTELKSLGRVEQESQGGEEVTAQFVDLEARLANARNTESRLTELLRDRTGKLSDVLEVEQQVSRVRGEIEEMEAQRKSLTNLVEFATVTVRMTEGHKSTATLGRLDDAAVEGAERAAHGIIAAVVLLLSYGPGLAILAAGLYFAVRLARGSRLKLS